jgi:hypothetical protein
MYGNSPKAGPQNPRKAKNGIPSPTLKMIFKFRDLTKGKCFEIQRINLKSLLWWIRVSSPYGRHTWCIGINMRNPNLST